MTNGLMVGGWVGGGGPEVEVRPSHFPSPPVPGSSFPGERQILFKASDIFVALKFD